MKKEYITNTPSQTEAVGAEIAAMLGNDSFVALYGDMGAGKTVLSRGIVGALIPSALGLVHSPTYAIVNEYHGDELTVYHFDMYRISDPDELEAIGFYELMGRGAVLCEWSENIESAIPDDCIRVTIERTDENTRKITVETAKGE